MSNKTIKNKASMIKEEDAASVSPIDASMASHTVERGVETSVKTMPLASDSTSGSSFGNSNNPLSSDKPANGERRQSKKKKRKHGSATVKSTTNESVEIDKSPRASSSLTLPTTTKYGPDIGDAYYDSVSDDRSKQSLYAYYTKTVTSFLRANDMTVNKNFKDYDSFSKWIELQDVYAIDSPFREVMIDKESIKNKYLFESAPSNVFKRSNSDTHQLIFPDMVQRNYVLNLDGGMIRGKVTSTTAQDGDVMAQNSLLDRFNSSLRKGIITAADMSVISPNTNDIGIPALKSTLLPTNCNKLVTYTTRFNKLKQYSSYDLDHGFIGEVDNELYVTDNIINKTNAIESLFLRLQKWNTTNRGVLSGIANKQILTTVLNSTVPCITFFKILFESIRESLNNQGYIGSLTGAVDSAASSLTLKKNFDLNTIQDAVNEYIAKLDGYPYDVAVYNQWKLNKDAFKLKDSDSHNVDNSVVCPTFKFATNTIYDYNNTSTSNRTPSFVENVKNRWDNNNSDWHSLGSGYVQLNGLDRRMIVGFRMTPESVVEEIPHNSYYDIIMNYFFSTLYMSDIIPYLPYFKTTVYEGIALEDRKWGVNDLWNFLTTGDSAPWKSNKPTANTYAKTSKPYIDGANLLGPDQFTEVVAIQPIVSSWTFTGFMTAFCLFMTREKTFLDNFFNTMLRTKLFWKTIDEKVGLGPYFKLTDSSDTAPIKLMIGTGSEPKYDELRARNVFKTPFQTYNNYKTYFSRVVPVANGVIRNEATTKGQYDFVKGIYRQTFFIKNDGSTYYNPLNSRLRCVVYGAPKIDSIENVESIKNVTQHNFNSATDTLCYNNDIISYDLEGSQQYIGNHIGVVYNGTSNKTKYQTNDHQTVIPSLYGTYNFVYGLPYHPDRPRAQQRGLFVNTSDGYLQSVFFSAFSLPFMPLLAQYQEQVYDIAQTSAVNCIVLRPSLAESRILYYPKYVRNETGLATISTLRRELESQIYNYLDGDTAKIDIDKQYSYI